MAAMYLKADISNGDRHFWCSIANCISMREIEARRSRRNTVYNVEVTVANTQQVCFFPVVSTSRGTDAYLLHQAKLPRDDKLWDLEILSDIEEPFLLELNLRSGDESSQKSFQYHVDCKYLCDLAISSVFSHLGSRRSKGEAISTHPLFQIIIQNLVFDEAAGLMFLRAAESAKIAEYAHDHIDADSLQIIKQCYDEAEMEKSMRAAVMASLTAGSAGEPVRDSDVQAGMSRKSIAMSKRASNIFNAHFGEKFKLFGHLGQLTMHLRRHNAHGQEAAAPPVDEISSFAYVQEVLALPAGGRSRVSRNGIIKALRTETQLSPFIQDCSDDDLLPLAQACTLKSVVGQSETLAKEGDTIYHIYLILKGSLIMPFDESIIEKRHGDLIGAQLLAGMREWNCSITLKKTDSVQLCMIPADLVLRYIGVRRKDTKLYLIGFWKYMRLWPLFSDPRSKEQVIRDSLNSISDMASSSRQGRMSVAAGAADAATAAVVREDSVVDHKATGLVSPEQGVQHKPTVVESLERQSESSESSESASRDSDSDGDSDEVDVDARAQKDLQIDFSSVGKSETALASIAEGSVDLPEEQLGAAVELGGDEAEDHVAFSVDPAEVADEEVVDLALPPTFPLEPSHSTPNLRLRNSRGVVDTARVRYYNMGAELFTQKAPRQFLFVIVKGECALVRRISKVDAVDHDSGQKGASKSESEEHGHRKTFVRTEIDDATEVEVDVGQHLMAGDFCFMDGERADWLQQHDEGVARMLAELKQYPSSMRRRNVMFGLNLHSLLALTVVEACVVPLQQLYETGAIFQALLGISNQKYPHLVMSDSVLRSHWRESRRWDHVLPATVTRLMQQTMSSTPFAQQVVSTVQRGGKMIQSYRDITAGVTDRANVPSGSTWSSGSNSKDNRPTSAKAEASRPSSANHKSSRPATAASTAPSAWNTSRDSSSPHGRSTAPPLHPSSASSVSSNSKAAPQRPLSSPSPSSNSNQIKGGHLSPRGSKWR